jgi:hypothetical protein
VRHAVRHRRGAVLRGPRWRHAASVPYSTPSAAVGDARKRAQCTPTLTARTSPLSRVLPSPARRGGPLPALEVPLRRMRRRGSRVLYRARRSSGACTPFTFCDALHRHRRALDALRQAMSRVPASPNGRDPPRRRAPSPSLGSADQWEGGEDAPLVCRCDDAVRATAPQRAP